MIFSLRIPSVGDPRGIKAELLCIRDFYRASNVQKLAFILRNPVQTSFSFREPIPGGKFLSAGTGGTEAIVTVGPLSSRWEIPEYWDRRDANRCQSKISTLKVLRVAHTMAKAPKQVQRIDKRTFKINRLGKLVRRPVHCAWLYTKWIRESPGDLVMNISIIVFALHYNCYWGTSSIAAAILKPGKLKD